MQKLLLAALAAFASLTACAQTSSSTAAHIIHLQFDVITKILKIAKEGIFSGLNNLQVYNIFEKNFSEYYGLTEEEVLEGLKYYNLEYEINDVKNWYDGYQFGNTNS